MADDALLHATSAGVADDRSAGCGAALGGGRRRHRLQPVPPPSDGPDRLGRPINGDTPIAPPGTARKLRALVAPDSTEWLALAYGLSAVERGGRSLTIPPPFVELRYVDAGAVLGRPHRWFARMSATGGTGL